MHRMLVVTLFGREVAFIRLPDRLLMKGLLYRVGSQVVSVRIHCTEKWRTFFHTDALSKSK